MTKKKNNFIETHSHTHTLHKRKKYENKRNYANIMFLYVYNIT